MVVEWGRAADPVRPHDGPSEKLVTAPYVLYGLQLAANTSLPGLPERHDADPLDLRIWLKDLSTLPSPFPDSVEVFHTSSTLTAEGEPNLRAGIFPDGKCLAFLYGDGPRFAIDRRGREVWADWPEDYTLEDACTYLFGPVMGFVLRLRGTVCLHASAVGVDDRAIALVGQPGAGKSTTAAAFACCGFPVLSDDVVALADKGSQFLVQPGYPRINLWPDSVCRLFGSENALARITPTWDKRYLPLGQSGHHFASNSLPLGVVYLLDGRDKRLTSPIIEEVSGEEAFMALVANTYVNYLLDQNMRRTEFDVLSRIVSGIPVRRVRAPEEPSAVFGLCEAIAADARRVTAVASANAGSVLG
jgi:hypothetical protein